MHAYITKKHIYAHINEVVTLTYMHWTHNECCTLSSMGATGLKIYSLIKVTAHKLVK